MGRGVVRGRNSNLKHQSRSGTPGVAKLFAESRTAPEDAVLCQRALGRSETTHRLAPKDAVSAWCVVVVVSQCYGHFSPVYDRPCFLLCVKRHHPTLHLVVARPSEQTVRVKNSSAPRPLCWRLGRGKKNRRKKNTTNNSKRGQSPIPTVNNRGADPYTDNQEDSSRHRLSTNRMASDALWGHGNLASGFEASHGLIPALSAPSVVSVGSSAAHGASVAATPLGEVPDGEPSDSGVDVARLFGSVTSSLDLVGPEALVSALDTAGRARVYHRRAEGAALHIAQRAKK